VVACRPRVAGPAINPRWRLRATISGSARAGLSGWWCRGPCLVTLHELPDRCPWMGPAKVLGTPVWEAVSAWGKNAWDPQASSGLRVEETIHRFQGPISVGHGAVLAAFRDGEAMPQGGPILEALNASRCFIRRSLESKWPQRWPRLRFECVGAALVARSRLAPPRMLRQT
jgi:hypothetical protein